MRLQRRRASTRIEDRRGLGVPMGRGGGIGCAGLLLLLGIAYVTGVNPLVLLPLVDAVSDQGGQTAPVSTGPRGVPEDQLGQFAAQVLASTEDTWNELFRRELGADYREPTLVLFSGQVASACGFASAAVGPFYCPRDGKVYLDLSFFDELSRRFGAPGDFAQAYVLAHEIGHHIQNLTGISEQVELHQRRGGRAAANALSVRLELQADCFAGVWGHYAGRQGLLEPGDIEEGLRAAAAIGDDNIQRQAQGYVVPESFTHGTGDQRARWLREGLRTGDPQACRTFQG